MQANALHSSQPSGKTCLRIGPGSPAVVPMGADGSCPAGYAPNPLDGAGSVISDAAGGVAHQAAGAVASQIPGAQQIGQVAGALTSPNWWKGVGLLFGAVALIGVGLVLWRSGSSSGSSGGGGGPAPGARSSSPAAAEEEEGAEAA